jgi:hypothetical protein
MNESCVPKCFDLCKTCQDISLHSVKQYTIWLWVENAFVSILGSPTYFSVSLRPTLPLQEVKFPFGPGASPDPVVVTFCRARQARVGDKERVFYGSQCSSSGGSSSSVGNNMTENNEKLFTYD